MKWKLLTFSALLIALGSMILVSCDTEKKFGDCQDYRTTDGTCTIVSVVDAPEGDPNCTNDPVRVTFNFEPGEADGVHLTLGEGVNPPRAWVESEGLTEGSEHPCRMESQVEEGPCPPRFFTFMDIDEQAGLDLCYSD